MNNESGGKILSNRRYGKVLLGMFLVGIMMCFFYKDASAFGKSFKEQRDKRVCGDDSKSEGFC